MVYNAIHEDIDKDKLINDSTSTQEYQSVLYQCVKHATNVAALIISLHFKDAVSKKVLANLAKKKDEICQRKGKKKSLHELEAELKKLKSLEKKLFGYLTKHEEENQIEEEEEGESQDQENDQEDDDQEEDEEDEEEEEENGISEEDGDEEEEEGDEEEDIEEEEDDDEED